jgi:anthranilate phosphoribosyltransferase
MKTILNQLYNHEKLSKVEAKNVLKEIAEGKYNPVQTASFLTVFIMRNITLPELEGFREAMLELSIPINLKDKDPIDLCGTGGDGKDTFNISTLTSFVVAGAGIPVAKHGNYGVSSICGSSNVLEYLGVKFTNDEVTLQQQLNDAGICFLHAPLFHPAMKEVAPIRRDMGVKTFFNMLGPLTNPSRPKNQMVGVFNLELARMYQYLLQNSKSNYAIVHALDGFDEISLTDSHKIINPKGEFIQDASYFGFESAKYENLSGGKSIEDAAQIFQHILEGKGSASQEQVVLANSATAIQTYYPDKTISDSMELAVDSLLSGKANQAFKTLTS